jgi:hypothetical protein
LLLRTLYLILISTWGHFPTSLHPIKKKDAVKGVINLAEEPEADLLDIWMFISLSQIKRFLWLITTASAMALLISWCVCSWKQFSALFNKCDYSSSIF